MRRSDEDGRETAAYWRFLGPPLVDVEIAALAESQHALVRLDQLQTLGLAQRSVHNRARTGRLHRVFQTVYSLVPVPLLSQRGRWLAAVFACGEGAALSHRCAAALQDLRATAQRTIDVTVPGRSGRRHAGIAVHRSRTLSPADVTLVDNIPCTTVARTLLDLGDAIARRPLERAFDQAESCGALNLDAVRDQLARNHSRPAAAKIRALLDEHYVGSSLTRSELEERFLACCREAGVPRPQVNEYIVLPDGGPAIFADFVWRKQRVVIETDGWRTHRTRQKFESDRENDQRLLAHQWRPLRATWRQLERRPGVVVARAAKVLSG